MNVWHIFLKNDMKIFLDTNILLDVIQDRQGAPDALKIIEISRNDNNVRLYTSYLSMANIAFVLRHRLPEERNEALREMCKFCNVLPCTDMQLYQSLKNSDCPDFEDNLQIMCAEAERCDLILTNNPKHLRGYTELPVLSSKDFMEHCRQKQ